MWMMSTSSSLPEEVVIDILSHLPAKDLIRSRCVCKPWLILLTLNPHFHKLHLHHLTNNYPNTNTTLLLTHFQQCYFHLAATTDSNEAAAVELQFPFRIFSLKIIGTCYGLVCLANYNVIYIWNPLTREHVTLPSSPIPSHFLTPITNTTFGFCKATQQFKVIRFLTMTSTEIKSGYLSDFSVYTLGTNSWTSLGSIPSDINIIKNYTVLVNDALHWSAARPGSFVQNKFFSFNMKDDSFQVLPYPLGINCEYPNYVTFGELGGLLSIYHAPRNGFIDVWVMKEYGVVDSWTKQFRFELPEAAVSFYFMKPLGLADNGEIMMMENGGRIILYNPRTNTSRMRRKFDFEFDDVYCYAKSIVSPRLVNGVNSPQI